jgi:hypothetical protein
MFDSNSSTDAVNRSKSAYERQLREWRCRKHRPENIWKFIKLRLLERESTGKKSQVYHHGSLIDGANVQKRTARVHTTFVESQLACE